MNISILNQLDKRLFSNFSHASSTFLALITLGSCAVAAAAPETGSVAPLFASDEILELRLSGDLNELLNKRKTKARAPVSSSLQYTEPDGTMSEIQVNVSVRGNFRLTSGSCRYPPLWLDFSAASPPSGSLFAGQKRLPVVTQCRDRTDYGQYVLREYLAYRAYSLLSDNSLKVRLGTIDFQDTSSKDRSGVSTVFFIENFADLAARRGMRVVDMTFHPRHATPADMGLMEVFQYMIGNTDFSAVYQHNVLLLQRADGRILPVPYDFDFSGAVSAPYATPNPQFKTRNVRQRVYRGFCWPPGQLESVFAHFRDRESEIYALYQQEPALGVKSRRLLPGYFDDFFKILNSNKLLKRLILGACREF